MDTFLIGLIYLMQLTCNLYQHIPCILWQILAHECRSASGVFPDVMQPTFSSSTFDIYLLVLLRQCPNLIFSKFSMNSHWPAETIVDQEEVLLPHLESLTINDHAYNPNMVIIFYSINALALAMLSYEFHQHVSGYNPSPLPIPVLPLLYHSTLISYLSLDGELSSQDIQDCLRLGEQVTHVVFKKHHGYPFWFNTDPDSIHLDHFDLKILSIGSGDETLLPRLESLEAHNLLSFTDQDLLDLITSRIDASQWGEMAALKFVKMSFQRQRKRDIIEEVSWLAKEAGIEVKLDLDYLPEGSQSIDPLSPSFLFTLNNDK